MAPLSEHFLKKIFSLWKVKNIYFRSEPKYIIGVGGPENEKNSLHFELDQLGALKKI